MDLNRQIKALQLLTILMGGCIGWLLAPMTHLPGIAGILLGMSAMGLYLLAQGRE